ncbi:hypothetical protein ILP92_14925 [Maribius pontilimi]|uniref:Inner membrane protein n=1 Tax=Palleronia pontilimi TaxID=1964209 RepID=A0A934MF20_9RHOB|nr:hypothetical protein [Palleronia pontilimi]MBJ3764041.1 hypothetical protein [Palleronia pontilimi]
MFVNFIGLSAGLMVVLAFYARRQDIMRLFALGSNVLFIAYGCLEALYPIVLLHVILMALNVTRLTEDEDSVDDLTDDGQITALMHAEYRAAMNGIRYRIR